MGTQRFKKAEAIAHWRGLPDGQPLKAAAIPYKAGGSTYGHDGVRIEGSPAFIDAVLSRLKPLLAYENGSTRLAVCYQAVEGRPGKPNNGGDHVCYIKVHERGPEAKRMALIYGAH
jgi:hypothetical protein